jgi:hypothetical protein
VRPARALLLGAVTVLLLAGCGGSSHKTSTTAATRAPTTAASTAPTAKTPTAGIARRVLADDELHGFTGRPPSVQTTVSGFLAGNQTPAGQVASETRRLTRLGFVAAAHEDLTSHGRDGVSIVEQFKTSRGARSELANELEVFETQAGGLKDFAVPGIPGAVGLAVPSGAGVNVAFTSGRSYYLVGAVLPVDARSEATIVAAARRLYRRVHG